MAAANTLLAESPPMTPATAPAKERVMLLDAVRGFAVLGILICNAPDFAYPRMLAESPLAWPSGLTAANWAEWATVQTLFQQRLYSLFSMMFGVSIVLVGGEVFDRTRSWILARRLLWLIPIGLFHGFFLWWGDVLFAYAAAGLLVMGYRSFPPWRLVAIGVVLFLALMLQSAVPGLERLAGPTPPPLDMVAIKASAAKEALGFSGDFLASLKANMAAQWAWLPHQWDLVLHSASLMLIGMGLFRLGLFTGEAPRGAYLGLVAAGALCVLLIGFGVACGMALFPRPGAFFYLRMTQSLCAPVAALGFLSLLALALRSRWCAVVPRLLAPAGQMAFSNYIAQSVIMTAIFYGGRGLGLFNKLDPPALAAITVAIWAVQIAWSHAWLRSFEMGPLEWAWRCLYRGPKPLRRPKPLAESAQPLAA
jgi:uncharacterized protein